MKKSILILVLALTAQTYADDAPLTASMLGVDNVGVTNAEYDSLLNFVSNSKDDLQRIHSDAYGLPSQLALDKYVEGIHHILSTVRDGTKMLPAIIMSQGLNFVATLPGNIQGGGQPALRDEFNPQLKLAILKGAVLVAENYYYGKRRALDQQIMLNPPYADMAIDMFKQSLALWPSVMDTRSAIRYMHYTVMHTAALIKMMPSYEIHFKDVLMKIKEFQIVAERVEEKDASGRYLVNGLQLDDILRQMKYARKRMPGMAEEIFKLMKVQFALKARTIVPR